MCGFVSGTDIETVDVFTMWDCDGDGLPTTDECTWNGITCASGAVTQIDVSTTTNNGNIAIAGMLVCWCGCVAMRVFLFLLYVSCTGPLPSTIGSLTSLVHLDVNENYFNGGIPNSISSLTGLTYLNMGINYFTST